MDANPQIHRGREWQWTTTGWARAQRLALLAMLSTMFAVTFLDGTEQGKSLALFFTLLCAIGLLFSRTFEPAMVDFLRGLTPRDCVLYFLLHGVVMAIPGFLGYAGWTVAVASLIAFVCFVATDKLAFGRLHAASLVLALLVCASDPLPPFEPLALFVFLFLLCYRLEHLATRLGQYGEGRGVPVMPAALQTFVWLIVPWMLVSGLFFWLTPQMAAHTKFLVFEFGESRTATEVTREIQVGSIIRDLVILAGLIAALVYAVWWFERRLGLRRRGRSAETGETLRATSSTVRASTPRSAAPRPVLPKDARGRILMRLKTLLETTSREGLQRKGAETATEHLARVWKELELRTESSPSAGLEPFQRACYSDLGIKEEDADSFLTWAAAAETQIQVGAEQRRQAEASRDAIT